jgi:hypothetical protein
VRSAAALGLANREHRWHALGDVDGRRHAAAKARHLRPRRDRPSAADCRLAASAAAFSTAVRHSQHDTRETPFSAAEHLCFIPLDTCREIRFRPPTASEVRVKSGSGKSAPLLLGNAHGVPFRAVACGARHFSRDADQTQFKGTRPLVGPTWWQWTQAPFFATHPEATVP